MIKIVQQINKYKLLHFLLLKIVTYNVNVRSPVKNGHNSPDGFVLEEGNVIGAPEVQNQCQG